MQQATTDKSLTEHWRNDPSHKLNLSFGEASAFMHFTAKTDRYAKRLNKPVLVIQGLDDHLVSSKAVARLFKDIPSPEKQFLIDARGEHLILEEGRFTPTLLEKLVAWIKADAVATTPTTEVEVVNDTDISSQQQNKLSALKSLANSAGQ